MPDTLRIPKRSPLKGGDGHKVLSIRIKEEALKQIEEAAAKANRNRNQIINIFLKYAIENYEISE